MNRFIPSFVLITVAFLNPSYSSGDGRTSNAEKLAEYEALQLGKMLLDQNSISMPIDVKARCKWMGQTNGIDLFQVQIKSANPRIQLDYQMSMTDQFAHVSGDRYQLNSKERSVVAEETHPLIKMNQLRKVVQKLTVQYGLEWEKAYRIQVGNDAPSIPKDPDLARQVELKSFDLASMTITQISTRERNDYAGTIEVTYVIMALSKDNPLPVMARVTYLHHPTTQKSELDSSNTTVFGMRVRLPDAENAIEQTQISISNEIGRYMPEKIGANSLSWKDLRNFQVHLAPAETSVSYALVTFEVKSVDAVTGESRWIPYFYQYELSLYRSGNSAIRPQFALANVRSGFSGELCEPLLATPVFGLRAR